MKMSFETFLEQMDTFTREARGNEVKAALSKLSQHEIPLNALSRMARLYLRIGLSMHAVRLLHPRTRYLPSASSLRKDSASERDWTTQ